MSVSGDFAALRRLAERFHQVRDAMPRIARDMGAASLKLNKASFSAAGTPDGEAWKSGPYFHRLRGSTGRLAGGFRDASTGSSFGVRNVARYAFYHQHGAHLRDAIVGSAGRLRTKSFGPGRGRSGPRQRVRQQGPQRKGRLRGFLPARPVVPGGDVPRAWVPLLVRVAERRIERALGF